MKKRSNKALRLKRWFALSAALFIIIGALSVYVEWRLREVAVTFARNAVSSVLSSAINNAAVKLITENGLSYDKVSNVSRDAENKVTSVEINTNEINRFKSSLAEAVQKELEEKEEITVKVPLFSAFGLYYTYLSFPKLSYTLTASRVVSSDIKSEFFDAGINQVLHKISVTVRTGGNLALPGRDVFIEENADFTVAETVIVGTVPDAFTSIDYANEEIVDDVFDYGAEKTD